MVSGERKREGSDKNKNKKAKIGSNDQKKKKKFFAQGPRGKSICGPSQKAPEAALWTVGLA
jgi:hypothetical protein